MELKKITTISMQENIYILSADEKAFIIDPGLGVSEVTSYLEQENLQPQFIILTHGHGDHIYGVRELREKYQIPVYCYEKEKNLIEDAQLNLSTSLGRTEVIKCDHYFSETDNLTFAGEKIKIIPTPGHTVGSICILVGNDLFTGDTLFRMSIGRTDLPTSNDQDMRLSLKRLKELPGDIKVYPGHGENSTIQFEKDNNPFFVNI